MPTLYDPSHLLEATSWVHDLHRCVTTRSAALELGITRRAAAALLADLATGAANEQGGGAKYEVHFSRVVRDEHAAEGSCTTCECLLALHVNSCAFLHLVDLLFRRYLCSVLRRCTNTKNRHMSCRAGKFELHVPVRT